MKLPVAPNPYDARNEAQMRSALEREDMRNLKRGVAVDRLLLSSPSGKVWVLTVGNTGTLSVAALP